MELIQSTSRLETECWYKQFTITDMKAPNATKYSRVAFITIFTIPYAPFCHLNESAIPRFSYDSRDKMSLRIQR